MAEVKGLKEFLKSIPDASVVSGGREILIRCRFCGDSQTDKKAKHLYISLGSENKPPMYNCFKCNAHGVVTAKFLSMIANKSPDGDLIGNINSESSKYTKAGRKYSGTDRFNVRWDYISDTDLNRAKLFYINKRMGVNLTFKDLISLKIVPSIIDLLTLNHITEIFRNENIIREYDQSFLGFLSMNNGYLTLKNLRPGKIWQGIDHKYEDYPLFQSDRARRFYSIPTKINYMDPRPISVHIAEGVFDVLGIFFHVMGMNRYQNLYINCGDKAYGAVVKMLIQEYGLINCHFMIYPDNNVDDENIKRIDTLGMPLSIWRNLSKGEMDYGVTPDRIKHTFIWSNVTHRPI